MTRSANTPNCNSATRDYKKDDAVLISEDLSSIFFSATFLFENIQALLPINQFWRTFEVPRSKIVIWLEHLTNLLNETITVSMDSNAYNSAVQNWQFRDWTQSVSDNWSSWQSSNRKLFFCMRPNMRKLVHGNDHVQMLICDLA